MAKDPAVSNNKLFHLEQLPSRALYCQITLCQVEAASSPDNLYDGNHHTGVRGGERGVGDDGDDELKRD